MSAVQNSERVLDRLDAGQLQRLGRNGWSIVGAHPHAEGGIVFQFERPADTVTEAYYFGTFQDSGHYLWTKRLRKHDFPFRGESPVPWTRLDGKLYDESRQVEGECHLHHKDGWTALSFANRTDDSRPGSNSTFFFNAVLGFDQAVAAAREHFPRVTQAFKFDLVPAPE